MKTLLPVVLAALLVVFATACGRQPASPEIPAVDTQSVSTQSDADASMDKIAWFDGSIEEAFAQAKSERKPIFLYWGAVWCPPCHEIKVTVFDTLDFVQRSRLFVPVYLDGDTENAQAIGERFGVLGYPTMIVFSPDGVEITRIPGGIDIEAYATVLDLTLADVKPVSDLLIAVLDQDAELSVADCKLVAFNSWGQNETILAGRSEHVVFRRLHDACPMDLAIERSRLYVTYLDRLIAATRSDEAPLMLDDAQKSEGLVELNRFLDNYAAVKASIYSALFSGPTFAKALTEPGSAGRTALTKKYLDNLARIVEDEAVFKTERLYTVIGKMRFERIDNEDADISEQLKEETRQLIAWADKSTTDSYQRQTVMNAASNVLDEAGMTEEARRLLTAEIKKSKQPYYFMVSLADIEQAAGNDELAISLLKRAYDSATGPATRFQWGNYYVDGLIDMTPDDSDAIRAAILSVIGEIEAEGAFYQRNKVRLGRLEAKLMNWNADKQHDDSIEYIRNGVRAMCARIPADQPSRKTCENFLESA